MGGKTIKLFYVSGDPTGLRVADVMNWAGMAAAGWRLPDGRTLREVEAAELGEA